MTDQLYKTTRTTVTKYVDGEISEVTETEVIEPYFHSGGILPKVPTITPPYIPYPLPIITYGSGTGSISTDTAGDAGITQVNQQGLPLTDKPNGNVVVNLSVPPETDLDALSKMVSREISFDGKINDNSTKGNTNDLS